MFLMSQISGISIAGFVILALFVLIGLKMGFIRMLLNVLVIGLSIAAGALAVKPIYNALAKQDFFGQEWLEGALSGNFAFLIVGFAALVILLIIKAIIMHFVNKKGGKIKGALNVVNHVAGAVIGAGIGFLAFGFVLICYVTIYAFVKQVEVEQVVDDGKQRVPEDCGRTYQYHRIHRRRAGCRTGRPVHCGVKRYKTDNPLENSPAALAAGLFFRGGL